MILRQTGILLAIGVGIGAALALVLSGYVQSLVFGLQTHDPRALGLACVLLAAVATGAVFLPARRAALLDPSAALRKE